VLLGASVIAWLLLFFGWAIVVVDTDNSGNEITECSYEEVKCGRLAEFSYETTWPLLPLVLGVPSVATGWWFSRRVK
jgi:hypothetical protein